MVEIKILITKNLDVCIYNTKEKRISNCYGNLLECKTVRFYISLYYGEGQKRGQADFSRIEIIDDCPSKITPNYMEEL